MFGIENLKKVIDVAIGFATDFRTIWADKKFKLSELFLLVDNFSGTTEIVENWALVLQEFKDLDSTERASLNMHFAQKFDIPNNEVEEVIELALTNGLSLVALVEKISRLRKKP